MLPPDFFTINSSTIDWRQILIMMAWNHRKKVNKIWNTEHLSYMFKKTKHTRHVPTEKELQDRLIVTTTCHLLTGDGDPLEAIFAHQILEGQLQFDLALGWATGIGGAVGYRDLLSSLREGRESGFG